MFGREEKFWSSTKKEFAREQKFDTVLILGHRQSGKTSTAEKQMLGQKEKIASTLKQMCGGEEKIAATLN
jgi:predicted AAA+ superfamily ATPase